jgi:hypothetical protein
VIEADGPVPDALVARTVISILIRRALAIAHVGPVELPQSPPVHV